MSGAVSLESARIALRLVLGHPVPYLVTGSSLGLLWLATDLPLSGELGPGFWAELVIGSSGLLGWATAVAVSPDLRDRDDLFPDAVLGSRRSARAARALWGMGLGVVLALAGFVLVLNLLSRPLGPGLLASLCGSLLTASALSLTTLLLARFLGRTAILLASLGVLVLSLSPDLIAAHPSFAVVRALFFPVSPADWVAEDPAGAAGLARRALAGCGYDLGLAMLLSVTTRRV